MSRKNDHVTQKSTFKNRKFRILILVKNFSTSDISDFFSHFKVQLRNSRYLQKNFGISVDMSPKSGSQNWMFFHFFGTLPSGIYDL